MLRVERLNVSYDEGPALHEVSFKVEGGQIVSMVGADGAGKSTIGGRVRIVSRTILISKGGKRR